MSIAKPFTFVAGQKARANEVNADFDALYSQVNINIADIAQINRDIDSIVDTKADVNGNSTQRFAVANPVNSTDAINKQTMSRALTNVLYYITGLVISKDTARPSDTILVSAGSCYDSTKQVVLELQNITSKQNIGQGANATYHVYIIGNDTGSSIDILISNSSTTPTLPTGYTKFRRIGWFNTDGNKNISSISNYTNSINRTDILSWTMPDYSKGSNRSTNTTYTANVNGWVKAYMGSFNPGSTAGAQTITVNNIVVAAAQFNALSGSAGTISTVAIVPVPKGSTYRSTGEQIVFYPCKGES